MSTKVKIIFGLIALVLLLGIGYFLFYNSNGLSSAVTATAPASAAETTFLNLSSQIANISFDTSIFSDVRFTALVDMHTAVLPEAVGRTDPFAAIGGSSSKVSASSPTSATTPIPSASTLLPGT